MHFSKNTIGSFCKVLKWYWLKDSMTCKTFLNSSNEMKRPEVDLCLTQHWQDQVRQSGSFLYLQYLLFKSGKIAS